jgi:arylsulfatase A-like enzyme
VSVVNQKPEALSNQGMLACIAWMGLATGVIEAMRSWLWDHYFATSMFRNGHAIWMTPVAEVLVFVLVGGLLWGLTCCVPRRPRQAIVFGGLAVLSTLSLVWGYLYLWAVLLLGSGLTAVMVTTLRDSPGQLQRIVRVTTPWLLLLVVTSVLWQFARQADSRPVAARPLAGAPNVLLIVWDTVRADFVDWQPGNQRTPHLAELARHGVVLDRAIAPAPWTLPTHASLFTGLYPDQLSSNWHHPLDGASVTLSELYTRAGYATGGFAANHYYCTRSTGLDRGFQRYRDHELSWDELLRHCFAINWVARTKVGWSWLGVYDELGRKDGSQVVREFFAWSGQHRDRPFFAFLNFFDAHDPYLPDELSDGRELSVSDKLLLRVWRYCHPQDITSDEVELARACYATQIRKLDQYLGEIVAEFKRTGQWERTLIVVTGDHGEQFGEHELYSHGNSVYRPLVHVPLLVAFPGRVPGGLHLSQPVSLADVGQTTLQLTGTPGARKFPGGSMAALWTTSLPQDDLRPALTTVDPHPRASALPHMCLSPASKGKQVAVLTDDAYLICEGERVWHLYNFGMDPAEQTDLAQRPDHGEALLAAQQTLRQVLRSTLGHDASSTTQTWLTRIRD